MLSLKGFEIINEIQSGSRSQMFRGKRMSDGLPVIIKVLSEQIPEKLDFQKHIQDYKIGERLKDDNIISYYDWVQCHNGHAIIEEDYGAENLRSFLNKNTIGSDVFIDIAIQVAAGLETIHSNGIIHKDIKPENILINETTRVVKITDFSISSDISQEFHSEMPPEALEGTLPFISPELTGRMNRPIDIRSDFYSLGITFYLMLSGRLPFLSKDLLELIHAHIAIEPPTLHEINPSISGILSKIIVKLMSKSADDRYQSAYGLKADLIKCKQLLEVTGNIPDFDLGGEDNSSRFHISDKLYGRKKELEILLNTVRKTRQGHNELLLVSGYSGMGKTTLVNEIIRPVTKNNGRFISGKFEQSSTNIPYFGFIQAFGNLVRGILAESDLKLEEWKRKLISELAPNGQVIIDVIPEIGSITGDQPPVLKLEAADAQNRFNLVFTKFIQVVCELLNQVTIFLDNLQFADEASLRLIEIISLSHQINNLLIIGSYRDNDADLIRPLLTTLEKIRKAGINPVEINLEHLNVEDISQLINRSLKCGDEKSKQLADVIHEKTKGNPYFINQFLETLYDKNEIRFIETKDKTRGWEWDLESIKTKKIADNVIELMVEKLKRLPDNTMETLTLSAHIGNQFDVNRVEQISGVSKSDIIKNLEPAVKEGLILSKKDIEHFTEGTLNYQYVFLHDRVQQYVHSRMGNSEKEKVHLKIGRILLSREEKKDDRQNLFEIVNHLNLGSACIIEAPERNNLIKLNLEAGKKAKDSNVHESASDYLFKGIHLLSQNAWKTDYQLCFSLYFHAAESLFLKSDFEKMDDLIEVLLQNSKTIIEKASVFGLRIEVYVAQNKMQEALKIGMGILDEMGFKLPEKTSKLKIITEFIKTKSVLRGKSAEDLANLPELTDPEKIIVAQLIRKITIPAYAVNPELFVICIFKATRYFVKWGNTSECLFYTHYGFLLCGAIKKFEEGYHFGALGIRILETYSDCKNKGAIIHVFNVLIRYWKEHLRACLPGLIDAYNASIEIGQLEIAANSLYVHGMVGLYSGRNLNKLDKEMAENYRICLDLKHESALHLLGVHWQTAKNLCIDTETPTDLKSKLFNEDSMLKLYEQENDINAQNQYYADKIFLCFLFQQYSTVVELSDAFKKSLSQTPATFLNVIITFYYSLSLLADFDKQQKSKQKKIHKEIRQNLKQFKIWASHAPMNFLHKYYLIQAEYQRTKSGIKAQQYYRLAIRLANENRYLNEEAIANELCARYWTSLGETKTADLYLAEAYRLYQRWGAKTKVAELEKKNPRLSLAVSQKHKTTVSETGSSSGFTTSTSFDINSVMKASRAISTEIVLEKLLTNIVKIIIENSGAQKGFFIREIKNERVIEAAAILESDQIRTMPSVGINQSKDLCSAIINYVTRSNNHIILHNASKEGDFVHDPYIRENNVKSVLCTPFRYSGSFNCVLYLENNLMENTFTENRVEILQALLAQAAVSIEKAELFEKIMLVEKELRQNEEKYRMLVENSGTLILHIKLDGTILFINSTGAKKFLKKPADMIGTSFYRYVGDIENNVKKRISDIVKTGKGGIFEDFVLLPLGKYWYLSNIQPVKDEKGEISAIQYISQDISEHKKAKDQLNRLNKIIETTTDIVSISIPDLKIIYFNAAGKKLLNLKGDDYEDLQIKDFHPEWAYNIIAHEGIPTAIRDSVWTGETAILKPDGTEIPISQVITTNKTETGKLRYISTIMRDISELKRTEEELRKHQEQLEELVEERTSALKKAQGQLMEKAHKAGMADIAAGILHNIGNILNSINTSAETIDSILTNSSVKQLQKANELLRSNIDTLMDFIGENPKGPQLMEYYLKLEDSFVIEQKAAKNDIKRLKDGIRVIVDIITAQQKYAGLESFLEEHSLTAIVEDALTMQSSTIANSDITLVKNYSDVPKIFIQKAKLIHILVNLINNARDAMLNFPKKDRQLIIDLENDKINVFLKVTDKGEGISIDSLKKIFTHGYTTKDQGHGFGLHSCANLMTEMGGKMWVESEGSGKGSMFVLSFPIKRK